MEPHFRHQSAMASAQDSTRSKIVAAAPKELYQIFSVQGIQKCLWVQLEA
jgi:hypothetical protein